MRGKDGCVRDAVDSRGITPAYAGKRTPCRNTSLRYWDHPRVCGEKKLNISPVPPHQGSPPHMRGKEIWRLRWTTRKRITPAYAGKSFRGGFWGGNCRDHPRVCGEKIEQRIRDYQAGGSPPHILYCSLVCSRITPAYAGKSILSDALRAGREDHPRICGEKISVPCSRGYPTGSPPHMRGKVCILMDSRSTTGITPAYAGKRRYGRVGLRSGPDHPRICGEKNGTSRHQARWKGSPPHMRGKEVKNAIKIMMDRITPAYAGKSAMRGGIRL